MNNCANIKPVVLHVRGLGPVPAFKNSKLLARGRLLTKPAYKEWMDKCANSFVCQLYCDILTAADAILTGQQARSLIASLPPDDNWQCIPEIHVKAELCAKGEEGATITIERI
jgi:hypothetical protein